MSPTLAVRFQVGYDCERPKAGGWRYLPDPTLDYQDSVGTATQVIALASAKSNGFDVGDRTIDKAVSYLKSCQNENGTIGYRTKNDLTMRDWPFARTAAGMAALVATGDRTSDQLKSGVACLHGLGDPVFDPRISHYYFGHFLATRVMRELGEGDFRKWYPRIRDSLVNCQGLNGDWKQPPNKNYVAPDRDAFCTPMAIAILCAPYRSAAKQP